MNNPDEGVVNLERFWGSADENLCERVAHEAHVGPLRLLNGKTQRFE